MRSLFRSMLGLDRKASPREITSETEIRPDGPATTSSSKFGTAATRASERRTSTPKGLSSLPRISSWLGMTMLQASWKPTKLSILCSASAWRPTLNSRSSSYRPWTTDRSQKTRASSTSPWLTSSKYSGPARHPRPSSAWFKERQKRGSRRDTNSN